MSSREALNTNF